jgi:stage II sporulation protein M
MRLEREIPVFAAILFAIFMLSSYAGFIAGKESQEEIIKALEKFFQGFRDILSLDPILIMLIIFANNALKSLAAMLGGFFFGIYPVLFIASNGYLVGVIFAIKAPEVGFERVLIAILPHGVIEIPAVIIACSYGIWLGVRFYHALFGGEEFLPYLKKAINVYVKIIMPMLFIAAVIETFITPALISQVGS